MPEGPSAGSALSAEVVQALLAAGLTVATAESLTAGQLAASLAGVPGASGTLQGGVVAYQNGVKAELLGVDAGLLASRGAVDPEVAAQMAEGARVRLGADVGISTTGVAGPEPHQGQPVGTVYVGIAGVAGVAGRSGAEGPAAEPVILSLHLEGDRAAIRRQTVERALLALRDRLAVIR